MKARTLTPEQQVAKEQRKARFAELCRKLKGMGDGEKANWLHEAGAVVTVDGRALSPRNTLLCYFQRQGVTMVGGFRQWLAKGRCVRKGEHGLSILVPIGGKSENGEVIEDVHFIAGTVFDVSQTDEIASGEPVAVVAPHVAQAIGLADMPNVRVMDEAQSVLNI